MMGGTEVKALVDLAAAMGIHSGTFHVQAIAEKAAEQIHHLTTKVTSLEQDNTWLRGKVAEYLRERDALRVKMGEAEQGAEAAYTSAEATIRAEIADGGTSCHWCLDKTAKAERERCVGLGFALHAAFATESENDYTRGYCDAPRNYANAIEAMVSLGAKDNAATSAPRRAETR